MQETTLLGLLDTSATFDTVDFEILLRRLETSYRLLNGTVLKWLTSFVIDRTQVINFDGNTSLPAKHASVLGWLLFVLYAANGMKIVKSHGVLYLRLC